MSDSQYDEWASAIGRFHDAITPQTTLTLLALLDAEREARASAEAAVAALRDALERIGGKCRVVHMGYPPGTTCLDKQREAIGLTFDPASSGFQYAEPYRSELASGALLCEGCVVSQALADTRAAAEAHDAAIRREAVVPYLRLVEAATFVHEHEGKIGLAALCAALGEIREPSDA